MADTAWLHAADLTWERFLLPVALRRMPEAASLRTACLAEIVAQEGRRVERSSGHDGGIPGWAWVQGTAAWVEPTCYALASLQSLGQRDHPRAQQGQALLTNRQCPDGGWNYGNPEVLGQALESFPGPTAWAVQVMPPSEATTRGLERLEAVLERGSVTSLALAMLARAAHGLSLDDWLPLLLARQQPDGSFGGERVDRTALALAAIRATQGAPPPFSTLATQ